MRLLFFKSCLSLHPRYWPTWLALAILFGINQLPYRIQLKIGQYLGRCGLLVLKRFRTIASTNLALCFPKQSAAARKQLLRKHFESLGMGVVECAMAYWTAPHKLAGLLQIKGKEYLEQAISKQQGTLMLSGHFTSLDLCGRLFSTVFPLHAVYREQTNLVIDRLLKKQRKHQSLQPIHRHAIRTIIQALKKNATLWYAMDQDYGAKHACFASFFNILAATITIPSRYAKKTQAQALIVFYHRLPAAQGYQAIIQPLAHDFQRLSAEQMAQRFNQLLEQQIRHYPEQYLWIHRRFKTRPPGETSFYAS